MALRIASFDIGRVNFAQYLEDSSIESLRSLSKRYSSLPKSQQRRVKGKMTKDISDILNEMYLNSERLDFGVFDLSSVDSDTLDHECRLNILQHLQSFKEWWDSCDVFILEQQFFTNAPWAKNKGQGGANMVANRIAEIVYSFFLLTYDSKIEELSVDTSLDYIEDSIAKGKKFILNLSSTFKTNILGAPDKLTKPKRKEWSRVKALEICELRGDEEGIALLSGKKKRGEKRISKGKNKLTQNKKDDVSDAMLQCQAMKMKYFIGRF